MAVEQIKAWQISTGQTFAIKAEAYHEELIYLIRSRNETTTKGFDLGTFDEAIEDQRKLVAELIEMRKGLDGRSDKKTQIELDTLLVDADKWLASATQVRKDMDS